MLPRDVRDIRSGGSKPSKPSDSKFPQYIRRLLDFRQMDFEATFDQMLNLLSLDPQRTYISFYYRKQTKNQWARDDPAFIFVQFIFVATAALAYAIAFKHYSFWGYLWSVFYCILVDWLLLGCIIASTTSYFANKYLRQYHSHSVEQEVEWLYAFDIHANSFFCSFFVTYVLQYFLLPLLLSRSSIACLASNSLYALSAIWYFYITYLGYRALPFVSSPQVFLWYPVVATIAAWLITVVLVVVGLRLNLTRIIMAFHYG